MNHITHEILSLLGFRLYKKPFLPKGVDWLWDIYRLTQHQPPSVFIDVGANQGQTALAIHTQFPSAIIHSFEPVESTFSQLKHNTSHVPQIVPVKKAVGEFSGKVKFQLYQSTSLLNRVATQEEVFRGNYLEEVEMISLREYCKQMGIARVDVLKTDAQGYDVSVLKEILPVAAELSIQFIFVEVTFTKDPDCTLFFPVNELLSSVGFTLYGLYNYWHRKNCSILYCDALFIKPR